MLTLSCNLPDKSFLLLLTGSCAALCCLKKSLLSCKVAKLRMHKKGKIQIIGKNDLGSIWSKEMLLEQFLFSIEKYFINYYDKEAS